MTMNTYTKLAKEAIATYLKTGKQMQIPTNLPTEMTDNKSGVFVTLLAGPQRKLRGCIGTYRPTKESIAAEIISNAIAAAIKDYRFPPIEISELSQICYEVSILHKPEQVKTLEDLNVKKYGVIVKSTDRRSGLLLPNIESVDTPEKQVAIAAQKGGINLDRDQIYLFRFSVDKYADE